MSFFTPPSTKLDNVIGFDKVVHFGMYGFLCTVIMLEQSFVYELKKVAKGKLLFFGAVILPILISGLIEILQENCTEGRRSGDIYDFVANSLGVICAFLFVPRFMSRFSFFRNVLLRIRRLQLKNKEVTIISNNCIGGFIYHDLKLRFNSPTINMFINAYDYNRLLWYIANRKPIADLVDITKEGDDCPQALLNGDVRISMVHYKSFEEAKKKWLERMQRIDYNNIFVIYCQASVRTDILEEFDEQPFRNKIALVNKPYPNIKSSFVIKGFEDQEKLGYIFDKYKWYGLNYYDQINWSKFLNSESTI